MRLPEHITLFGSILKDYFFYRKSYNWNKQQLLDYQNRKLKEIVQYSGKYVPYYRKLFKEIGLDLYNFKGIEDMEKIPLLDKETLRTRNKEFISDISFRLNVKIAKTSGSTGTPLELYIDEKSRSNKFAAFARAYFWAGYRPGALRFVLKGFSESKSKPYGYDALRNMIYLNSSDMTKENCMGVLKLLHNKRVNIYEGYARSFIDFSKKIEESDISLFPPKGILCYGETVTDSMRDYIEKTYGAKLFDFYSHSENSAMICQMPDNKKYLMEDYFYPEVIDINENKHSLNGELIGTSFYNYGMPLIRYKTGDSVIINKTGDSLFREVIEIEGRKDDFIIAPDGRLVILVEGAITYAKGVIASQLVQEEKDSITVNIVADDNFKDIYIDKIKEGLIKRIGTSLMINVKKVEELEKNKSGKAPFILSKIGNEFNNTEEL